MEPVEIFLKQQEMKWKRKQEIRDKMLRENPIETIDKLIGLLKKAYEVGESSAILGLEVGLSNAVNYSEWKGYITQEQAEDYRKKSSQISEEAKK